MKRTEQERVEAIRRRGEIARGEFRRRQAGETVDVRRVWVKETNPRRITLNEDDNGDWEVRVTFCMGHLLVETGNNVPEDGIFEVSWRLIDWLKEEA